MIFNLFGSKKKKEDDRTRLDPYLQNPNEYQKPKDDPYAQRTNEYQKPKDDPYAQNPYEYQKPKDDPYADSSNEYQKPKDDPYTAKPKDNDKSSIKCPTVGTFRLEDVRRNANAAVPTEKNRKLAYGAFRYAEVIAENFPDKEIDYMVKPSQLDPEAEPEALPIHFLFKENGVPKVAVVIVTKNGYNTPRVVETELWCEEKGIKYIRMFADGTYADWIYGEYNDRFDPDELVAFCKNWIVEKISDALKEAH